MCAWWWHVMYIQARKYELGKPILQLPGIMHGVIGPLLWYYYKQCYLSYKISYEIVLNVLLWKAYFNLGIYPIFFMGASTGSWNDVTGCQILASSWNTTLWNSNCNTTWCNTGYKVWLIQYRVCIKMGITAICITYSILDPILQTSSYKILLPSFRNLNCLLWIKSS